MYVSFGDKIPSFSLRIVFTMGGQLGIWNITWGMNLRKKFVGGDSALSDGAAIG